jgi:hypothetical protein
VHEWYLSLLERQRIATAGRGYGVREIAQRLGMELTGMVDTPGLQPQRRPVTEQELTRRATRRLAVLRHTEEITGNPALACRDYGISRQCFYTWKRCNDAHATAWTGSETAPTVPRSAPTPPGLRWWARLSTCASTTTLGRPGSPCTYKRYHEVQISSSCVWRILKRLELNRLPASQRYKRQTGAGNAMRSPCRPSRAARRQVHRASSRYPKAKTNYQFTAIDYCMGRSTRSGLAVLVSGGSTLV